MYVRCTARPKMTVHNRSTIIRSDSILKKGLSLFEEGEGDMTHFIGVMTLDLIHPPKYF